MRNPFSKEAWLFVALTALSIWVTFTFVNLTPQVDYDLFFSKEDPSVKSDVNISRQFPRNDSQIIISIGGDIRSEEYREKIKDFGDLLIGLGGVKDVKSIVHGPKNFNRALHSPFWSRLLLSDEGKSSNIIIITHERLDQFPDLIAKIEHLKAVFDDDHFVVRLSGYPYISDLILKYLNRDLRVFTVLSFFVFGIVVVRIFQSWLVFLGMVVACFNAAASTLILTGLLNVKIGILTANLTTIVFVMTLSHIVFLTFNWRSLHPRADRHKAVQDAIKMTLPASFWSMFTTLLGFASLLHVQAKPIRELGICGVIGTCLAILMAYCVYPTFLRLRTPASSVGDGQNGDSLKNIFHRFNKVRILFVGLIAVIVIVTFPYLKKLNTDPSLISFFPNNSPITEGLKEIDRHGGSNPLVMVVKDRQDLKLYKKEPLKRLWSLHNDFEAHENVGTVLSMPPLLTEARQSSFFSFLLTNRYLLKIMDQPKYGHISRGFISGDHEKALFLLRMKEDNRTKHRLDIIEELKTVTRDNGFVPLSAGGIYALQGQLSRQVATSLIFGLVQLVAVFSFIAYITAFNLRTAFAMTFSIALIPLGILGPIGAFGIPLDTITAPAANLAVGMGIDAMIHMTYGYRRLCKSNPDMTNKWEAVRIKYFEPVFTSMMIVSCGFGIFFFSSFPPTQRFGGSIVWGTLFAAICAMFIFPPLAQLGWPRRGSQRVPRRSHRLQKLLSSNDDDSGAAPLN